MTPKQYWFGLLLGVAGSACFSGKAIIVKLAYQYGADATTLIALRMLVAAPLFALAAWWTSLQPAVVNQSGWRPRDTWRVIALGAVGYYAASFLDFLGLQYISAGLERIILYLAPTFVLLMSIFALRKKVSKHEYLALGLSYSGVVFVFWHDLKFVGSNIWLGGGLVLASAVCYAVYLTSSGEMVKRLGSVRLTSWASLVSSALCIVQALVLMPSALLSQPAPVYWLSLINGTVCTVIPVFLTMFAIEKIGSTAASQTGLVGPVVTIVLAYWFLSEPITATQIIGTVVVISGILVLSFKKQR